MLYIAANDPEDSSAVATILHDWCQRSFQSRGQSQKALEIATAERMKWMEATAFCLSAILNEMRLKEYEKLAREEGGIPGIMASDLYAKLRDMRSGWERMIEATKDDREARKDAIERFLTSDVQRFILNAVTDEKMFEIEEARHRKAVLDGREEPTADDAQWLTQLRDEADEQSRILRSATQAAKRAAAAIPTPEDAPL